MQKQQCFCQNRPTRMDFTLFHVKFSYFQSPTYFYIVLDTKMHRRTYMFSYTIVWMPTVLCGESWFSCISTKIINIWWLSSKCYLFAAESPTFGPGLKPSIFLKEYLWFRGSLARKSKLFTEIEWNHQNPCHFPENPLILPKSHDF